MNEAQIKAIAEFEGWRDIDTSGKYFIGVHPEKITKCVPLYDKDGDIDRVVRLLKNKQIDYIIALIHEVEKGLVSTLGFASREPWAGFYVREVEHLLSATVEQKQTALIIALGLEEVK